MIFDRLENLDFYLSQHHLLPSVVSFLQDQKHVCLNPGSHWINNPDLRVIKEPCVGKGKNKGILEVHKAHIDIQIALKGCDRIGYKPLSDCLFPQSSFDSVKDIQFFNDSPLFWIDLPPGHFCIFFPQDAHAPLSCDGDLEKLIFKLKT